ncbi:MAG: DUF4157 domain-containing protein, partial [Acetatifactor sp.]|nr:DUF4157 domain-containing protein [Acetatifactor sp.]
MHQEKNRQKELSEQNHTGIPTQLKKRVEDSTALELDDVRIHYNSGRPAELDALAYTQGTQVYLGPGQERHLPHELGHVVQQKLGMVRADTRHESGAALNTDQALERQADRIGAGSERMAMSIARRHSEPIVQRMSVLENGDELGAARAGGRAFIPRIGRYKRSGWQAVQKLKEYLSETCIEKVNMGNLDELSRTIPILETEQFYDRMARVADGMGVFEYEPKFQSELREKMGAAGVARTLLEEWNGIAGELRAVLEQCKEVEGMTDEEKTQMPVQGLEKKGQYQRLGLIDPYFNYKKAALHCIARKASTVQVRGGGSVGPHIALNVMGKNIYAAINSHKEGRALKSDDTLAVKIRGAISEITPDDITRFLLADSNFEQGTDKDKVPDTQEVYQYIQQLEGYSVLIVDAPEYRSIKPGKVGPIHGEMAIMDFLQNNEAGKQVIAARDAKLNEINPPPGGEVKRVIWIGGTKVDCVMCHDHFGKINGLVSRRIDQNISLGDDLGRNYVVSSREVGNEGEAYSGTKVGTHLHAKKNRVEKGSSNI